MPKQETPKFSISEAMDLLTDKELDKTKEALEDLKDEVDKLNEKNIGEAMERVKSAFAEDAEELDLSETDRDGYWQTIEMKVKTDILKETPEFENLNNYVDDIENLTGLRDVINDKDPIRKLKTIAKEMGILTGLAGAMRNWADSMKGEKENDTFLGNIVRKWADKLEATSEKPEVKPQTPNAPKPLVESEKKEEAPKLSERDQITLDAFKKMGFTLDVNSIKADMPLLKQNGFELDDYLKNLSPSDALKKINESVKKVTGGKALQARLIDLATTLYSPDKTEEVIAAIEDKPESKYKLKDQTAESIRQFLTDYNIQTATGEDHLKKYERA